MLQAIESEVLQKSASYFDSLSHKNAKEPLYALCRDGLRFLAEHRKAIDVDSLTSKDFFWELVHVAHVLGEQLPSHNYKDSQALAFQLFEGMALVLHELALQGCLQGQKEIEAVRRFFEGSGLWTESDQTLVAQYYHYVIPNAVKEKMIIASQA